MFPSVFLLFCYCHFLQFYFVFTAAIGFTNATNESQTETDRYSNDDLKLKIMELDYITFSLGLTTTSI